MAKRKRLTPAVLTGAEDAAPTAAPARPPIAHVAGDSAVAAALQEVSGELQRAQQEGRLVISVPLEMVDPNYLLRERVSISVEEEQALKASLSARGQQTPIEVVDRGEDFPVGRYGLISGWRRFMALEKLWLETKEARFDVILALVKQPTASADAYVAMVEENEIRSNLSYYERARLVVQAVKAGVFQSDKDALQTLFANVSWSKRSKIKSFMTIVTELGGVLRFPAGLSERLGLALSKALSEDEFFVARVSILLSEADAQDQAAEQRILQRALAQEKTVTKAPISDTKRENRTVLSDAFLIAPGVRISTAENQITLEGDGVNPGFTERLKDWLRDQR